MKYTSFGGYNISQLTLGTVQLGLDYGISNASGVPDPDERKRMLKVAVDAGINTIDTARQYGKSEEALGDFVKNDRGRSSVNFVSKFKISPQNLVHPERAWNEVCESVKTSVQTLGIGKLPVCLFHKGEEPIRVVMAILPEIIRRLKEEDLISIGGMSAYFPDDVRWLLDNNEIAAAQIPLNIFDQRLIKTGLLDEMKAAGKMVFARSVFLQGLFFLSAGQLKGTLKKAELHLKSLNKIAERAEMTVAQLAFSFVRDLPGVNSIVFGAVNAEQVHENVRLLEGKAVSPDLLLEIQALFANVEEELITPGSWNLKV